MKFGKEGPLACARVGCGKPATWFPMLRLFARGFKYAPPASMLMELPTCEACTKTTPVESLVTDQSWATIQQIFEAGGKAEPDRIRTQIAWWKIEDAQAGRLPT